MNIRNEFEYRRLRQALDRLTENRREVFTDMVKKLHSGRGGFRGGVKPTLPEWKKRVTVNARLPKWMLDALSQEGQVGKVLENLILKAGYKPPEDD